MGSPRQVATPSAFVLRPGATSSQSFFFSTALGAAGGACACGELGDTLKLQSATVIYSPGSEYLQTRAVRQLSRPECMAHMASLNRGAGRPAGSTDMLQQASMSVSSTAPTSRPGQQADPKGGWPAPRRA